MKHRVEKACALSITLLGILSSCSGSPDSAGIAAAPDQTGVAEIRLKLLERLDSELVRQGSDFGDKTTCAAKDCMLWPAANARFDELSGAAQGVDICWVEQLAGDYDLNGEVNVQDLTPLGLYYGQVPATFESLPWILSETLNAKPPYERVDRGTTWEKILCDGDRNGELSIADVTPVAQHFGQELDGYRIWRRKLGGDWVRLNGAGAPTPLTISRVQAKALYTDQWDRSQPLAYYFHDSTAPLGELEYRVEPYSLSLDMAGTTSVNFAVFNNQRSNVPSISVYYSSSADVGQDTEFQVNSGYYPIGQLGAYAQDPDAWVWLDFDGDGNYDIDFPGAGPRQLKHRYDAVGDYNFRVRLRLGSGEVAYFEGQIQVIQNHPPVLKFRTELSDTFVPATLTIDASDSRDPDGQGLQFAFGISPTGTEPVATVGNNVIYIDIPGNYTLSVVATDPLGAETKATAEFSLAEGGEQSAQWDFHTVFETDLSGTGSYMSAPSAGAEIAGRPALCCYDSASVSDGRLLYFRGGDQLGTGWEVAREIVSGLFTAEQPGFLLYPRLADLGGRPGIVALRAIAPFPLRYQSVLSCSPDAAGSVWSGPQFVDLSVPLAGRLGLLDGLACYVSTFGGQQNCLLADETDQFSTPFDGPDLVSADTVFIGNVVHVIGGQNGILASHSIDSAGAQWTEPIPLPGLDNYNIYTAFDCAGRPAALCTPKQSGPLNRIAIATSAEAGQWLVYDLPAVEAPLLLSPVGAGAADGRPAIAFSSALASELWLSWAQDAGGSAWPAPGLVDSRGSIQGPVSVFAVEGTPALVYTAILQHSADAHTAEVRYARMH